MTVKIASSSSELMWTIPLIKRQTNLVKTTHKEILDFHIV